MRIMKMLIYSIALITLLSCSTDNESKAVDNVSIQTTKNYLLKPEEFKKMILNEDVVILDVRTAYEVAGGNIYGAINIDYNGDNFKESISELDKSKTYLVYCHSGGRSSKTRTVMNDLGFKDVYDLQGGITSWKNQGYDWELK